MHSSMTSSNKSLTSHCTERKAKAATVSEMIQSRRNEGRPYVPGELREAILQREMARHNFTKKQALAVILAFSRQVSSLT